MNIYESQSLLEAVNQGKQMTKYEYTDRNENESQMYTCLPY